MHLIVARQSIDLTGQSGPLNTASLDDKYTDKKISSLLRHANTRAIGATLDFDATLADKKSLVGMQACHQAWTPCLAGDCVEQIWTCVEHATAPMNAMEEAWKSLVILRWLQEEARYADACPPCLAAEGVQSSA